MIAQLKGVPIEQVTEAAWKNTVEVFGLDDIPIGQEMGVVVPPKKEFDLKNEEWPAL